ncbi:RHS repeat-associated core domain-containing protein [Hymenobacter sp.]|jgi:RHS repeat-associated protein|uniref:RHS repeat-associated core domain-containing protein n=1 Tax=Hymenobacter sp. TaxID=1898978 RepID=UPI002ED890E5
MAIDDKYVMNGVWLTCDKGVTPSRFNVTPKPVQLYDEHFANELDKIPLVNIMPFGVCSVSHSPCVPVPLLWEQVMEDGLTVMGARPLLDTSKCMCSLGGKIAIHFTEAGATAAVELDKQLDQADALAEAAEKASGWAFWGGVALAVGGAVLCATGVGAPLGAAMIAGGGHLITASTVLAVGAAVTKGVTNFSRDPSLQNGLSIVGQVAKDLAIDYVMNKLGGRVVKGLGKAAQKAMNKLGLSERASGLANRILCTVTGHPVDVIGGYLYTEATDFEFPGPVPLRWERLWNSTSVHQGPLGSGWHHSYDMALFVDAEQGLVAFRAADGRGIAFDLVPLGQRDYNRLEKMSLLHDERGYAILDHGQNLVYRFGVNRGDGVSPLAAVENRNGFSITFGYNGHGHLTEIVDSARRVFRVSCDEQGRIRTIATAHPTEPKKIVTLVHYSYSRQGELLSCEDALGQQAHYKYRNGLLVQETFKNGLSFYFQYEGAGTEARCIRTWGDEGIYDHKLLYDVANRRTVVTNSLGQEATYIGNENGLVVQHIDRRGGLHQTEYNEYNEVLSETNPLGYETRYEYDERGNCTEKTMPDGSTVRMAFDENDQRVKVIDTVGGQWQWVYDAAGNVLESTDPIGNLTRYQYEQGLLRRMHDAAFHSTEVSYDSMYNLREMQTSEGAVCRWLYNKWGLPTKTTDARGNVQWREYDLLSQVTALYEPDGNVRRFAYDAMGNVMRVQDRHHDIAYAYRGVNRLIRRVEAGTNTDFLYNTEEQLRAIVNEHGLTYRFELDAEGSVLTEAGFDGLTRCYSRDIGGRVLQVELPTGHTTRFTYDRAGRTTKVLYSDGSAETYAYRADGTLITAANNSITVAFEHDVLGNVMKETQGEHTVSYSYNSQSQRIKIMSSLGTEVSYKRDATGDIEQVRSGNWQAQFERDTQGLELQRTFSGGIRTRWKRDSLGRPTEQQVVSPTIHSERARTYTWQESGRLTHIQDSHDGITRFEHDAVGNLSSTIFGDGTRELRQHDAVGNLFQTANKQDRRYGPAGQLLEANSTRYTYDELGNLASKKTVHGQEWQYVWNVAGRLAEVVCPDGKVVRFAYDALGRRIRKTYCGRVTRWIWDGHKILHEWNELEVSADNVDQVITWLFEEGRQAPIAKIVGDESYGFITDHLGTPLQMHDQHGQVVWSGELNSYGKVRKSYGSLDGCPFRYQGQYEDVETGLYYNRFRYYDPEAGSYISQDPIGLKGGDKAYSYVHDPIVYVDPLGLAPWPTGGFGEWFDNASVSDVLANKQDVSNALRGSGGMHEMFPVSMAAKAKELGFTHSELTGLTKQRDGLMFENVPDRFGNTHSGPHSTGMPLPAGQSSKASSWFHKNLMADLDGAKTKSEALDIIQKHHTTHCK